MPAVGKSKSCKQMTHQAPLDYHAWFILCVCVCFCDTANSTMLHRNMRTAGVELPEVGSKEVPLIGYRPLPPDAGGPAGQWAKEAMGRERTSSQVRLKCVSWLTACSSSSSSSSSSLRVIKSSGCNIITLVLGQIKRVIQVIKGAAL